MHRKNYLVRGNEVYSISFPPSHEMLSRAHEIKKFSACPFAGSVGYPILVLLQALIVFRGLRVIQLNFFNCNNLNGSLYLSLKLKPWLEVRGGGLSPPQLRGGVGW